MKRDTHLEAPDAEQQRACHTRRHEGPIAFLHLVPQSQLQQGQLQQGQLNVAPAAACSNDMLAKQAAAILKRLDWLVDPHRTQRYRSRSGDYQIMHPETLRPDSQGPATILPNFH
ncbi:hypothetical protein ABIB82_002945 [Bradyrhizobium sp. i1.8.4]|uniref:hypothetical protein n=1 Tax=unclassified Bradyrhizobium TaxID=2631580 RepID=UPI003D1F19A4